MALEPYFVITSEGGQVYSNEIQSEGIGVEIGSRLTGLGLPPVAAQFDEGLGDGSTYRGTRVQSRSLDFNAHVYAPSRSQLRAILDRFAMVLAHPCTVTFVDLIAQETWSVTAARTGGGDYSYGEDGDSGKTYVNLSWTMQTDDPYWQAETILTASNVDDAIPVDNHGTVASPAIVRVTGPTVGFKVTEPISGDAVEFAGYIPEGQTVTVNGTTGKVYDDTGADRYNELTSSPLFLVPPGRRDLMFEYDQSTVTLEDYLVRTNHVINSSFGITPTVGQGWTIPAMHTWDSTNQRINFRTYGNRTSTNTASIEYALTGLAVGTAYQVRYSFTQNLVTWQWDSIGPATMSVLPAGGGWPIASQQTHPVVGSNGVPIIAGGERVLSFTATSTTHTMRFTPATATRFEDTPKRWNGGYVTYIGVAETGKWFDGNTADTDTIEYAWLGTVSDSKSTETTTYDVEVPVEGAGLAAEVEFRPSRWLVI